MLRAEVLKLCIAAAASRLSWSLSATERRERAPPPTAKGLLLTLAVGAGYQALNILGASRCGSSTNRRCFAVIVQSKVVWTGVLGYLRLEEGCRPRVFSLVLVAAGAAVCAAPKPNTDASKVRTRITGCLLAGGAALLSAILTVACEAVVKRGRASLHWQNLQLYVVGILVTASTLTRPPSLVISYAMGALIVLEACKGLAISLVLKRTDAVVKTLATLHPGVTVGKAGRAGRRTDGAAHMRRGGVLAITVYHEASTAAMSATRALFGVTPIGAALPGRCCAVAALRSSGPPDQIAYRPSASLGVKRGARSAAAVGAGPDRTPRSGLHRALSSSQSFPTPRSCGARKGRSRPMRGQTQNPLPITLPRSPSHADHPLSAARGDLRALPHASSQCAHDAGRRAPEFCGFRAGPAAASRLFFRSFSRASSPFSRAAHFAFPCSKRTPPSTPRRTTRPPIIRLGV